MIATCLYTTCSIIYKDLSYYLLYPCLLYLYVCVYLFVFVRLCRARLTCGCGSSTRSRGTASGPSRGTTVRVYMYTSIRICAALIYIYILGNAVYAHWIYSLYIYTNTSIYHVYDLCIHRSYPVCAVPSVRSKRRQWERGRHHTNMESERQIDTCLICIFYLYTSTYTHLMTSLFYVVCVYTVYIYLIIYVSYQACVYMNSV